MSAPQPTITLDGYEYVRVEKPAPDAATAPRAGILDDYPAMGSIRDAARVLDMSTQRLNQLCREGKIPYVQVSERKRVIPRAHLEAWIEAGGCRG